MLKFMSGVSGPPEGEEEQRRITSTLHALDHATRFAETASGEAAFTTTKGGPEGSGANGRIWPAMMSAELPEGWAWAS